MSFASPFATLAIPETNIWSFLFERATKPFSDSKVIFTDGETDRKYTFGDLRSTSLAFGRGLKSRWGWAKDDVLAFYTPNNIDTPALVLGLLWAGGIGSPANPLYTEPELALQLRDSGAKGIVTLLPFLETARKAARKVGIPEDRILLLGDQIDPSGRTQHFQSICEPFTKTTLTALPAAVNAQKDLAFLVYSSGTTGLPKGVCLSHFNIVANILQMATVDGLSFHPYGGLGGQGDKALGITPFFHIYGLVCCMLAFVYNGWELVIMQRFDVEGACQLIDKYSLTFAYVPPPVILALSKHPVVDKYSLSSLRVLNSGAAPLTVELAMALWDRLKVAVKQGYGLSESSPTATMQSIDEWGKFMGSAGKLMPNMEAKLVDVDTGEVVTAENTPGELWLKGPNIFLGYLNRPENTAATMSPCGFFKTGDIFIRDKHDNLFCVDRLKELIKYKGFQVPPAELEGILLSHPDIADAGVIGVEDPAQATEVPRAYVVLKAGVPKAGEEAVAKSREIADWMAKQTAPHKKLRGGVHFVDEIPKSASGKILRRMLRDRARGEEKAGRPKL